MRGKIAIVVMLSVAIAAAGFAWWQNYQRSVRARAFWGDQAATIRFARRVEAFRVEDGGDYTDVTDISNAPGLLNARTALMSDDGFAWSVEPVVPPSSNQWTYGVRFVSDDHTVTLLFSDQSDAMLVPELDKATQLDKKTAKGWRDYLQRVLAEKDDRR
jgi:hypothetical protein